MKDIVLHKTPANKYGKWVIYCDAHGYASSFYGEPYIVGDSIGLVYVKIDGEFSVIGIEKGETNRFLKEFTLINREDLPYYEKNVSDL